MESSPTRNVSLQNSCAFLNVPCKHHHMATCAPAYAQAWQLCNKQEPRNLLRNPLWSLLACQQDSMTDVNIPAWPESACQRDPCQCASMTTCQCDSLRTRWHDSRHTNILACLNVPMKKGNDLFINIEVYIVFVLNPRTEVDHASFYPNIRIEWVVVGQRRFKSVSVKGN